MGLDMIARGMQKVLLGMDGEVPRAGGDDLREDCVNCKESIDSVSEYE